MISFLNLSSAVLWKWIRKKFDLILSYTVSTQNQFMTRKNMNLTRLISQNKDDGLLNLEYFFLAVDKKAKSVNNESPFLYMISTIKRSTIFKWIKISTWNMKCLLISLTRTFSLNIGTQNWIETTETSIPRIDPSNIVASSNTNWT